MRRSKTLLFFKNIVRGFHRSYVGYACDEWKMCDGSRGIISDDVDKTIHNLTSIGREAMAETDKLVLSIMTNK